MKKTVSRLGSAALCVTLSLALGCGCAVMPPASSEKPASPAVSVPTDAEVFGYEVGAVPAGKEHSV